MVIFHRCVNVYQRVNALLFTTVILHFSKSCRRFAVALLPFFFANCGNPFYTHVSLQKPHILLVMFHEKSQVIRISPSLSRQSIRMLPSDTPFVFLHTSLSQYILLNPIILHDIRKPWLVYPHQKNHPNMVVNSEIHILQYVNTNHLPSGSLT